MKGRNNKQRRSYIYQRDNKDWFDPSFNMKSINNDDVKS